MGLVPAAFPNESPELRVASSSSLSSSEAGAPEVSQVLRESGVILPTKCFAARCKECFMHLSVKSDKVRQKNKAAQVLTTYHVPLLSTQSRLTHCPGAPEV